MTATKKHELAFWALQGPGWLLLIYLIYAQGISAFGYELGVAMGTQEPAERITEVGAAFWYGFALGDLLTYIPLLSVGLIGCLRDKHWGRIALAAALGITVYWPVVSLAALVDARDAAGWNISSEMPYWVVCLLIMIWGAWGLWFIIRNNEKITSEFGTKKWE
ncbi:MAG: hypothetical protein GY862_19640 [Gammaproteobacteria bacterium]|nr:hypothetical protein [Gammaproteobacteria bacterium]